MSFGAPLWLLALIPVALVAIVLRPRNAWAAWGLRAAAGVAIVVALAQPQVGSHDDGPSVLVLDRSASIDAAMSGREAAWVRTAIREHACASPCRVISFAAQPSFASVPAAGSLPSGADLGRGETDLAAALRLATGALPDGGRAVVLSDGLDTSPGDGGTLAAAARAARRAGVRVDTVPLTRGWPNASADDAADAADATGAAGGDAAGRAAGGTAAVAVPDAAVTRFVAPSPLHEGDSLTLQATVRSTVPRRATLRLSRDGVSIGRQRVALRAGDNPLLLTYRAPSAGWHAYRIEVAMEGDSVAANDALDATTQVGPAPRVLVVEGAPGRAGALPALLERDGIAVTVVAPQALGSQPPDADAVVLADVPERALGRTQVAALQRAVRSDGTGLLVLGGEHSLSLGGYAATPLDAMLPVQSLAPGGVRKRQLALELVLDRSSSMDDLAGGLDPKIAMARSAADSALRLAARDDDEFGVVAFDAAAHTIVPLQRATTANAGAIGSLIDALDADGGTNMARGLQSGITEIAPSRAAVKHLILLSDGVSEAADYAPLLDRMRRERITLSTIALGRAADDALLRRLAEQSGGRFYDVPDARRLPRVLSRDARRSTPSVAVRATLPVTAGGASPLVASLSGKRLPPLRGDVLTRLRPGATAALATEVNGAQTPVLAQWQYGLGRVVVWTPGAGAWAGGWLDDEPAVFADAARWSERGVAPAPLQPALDPADPGRVVVDPQATAGQSLTLGEVAGTSRTPAGETGPLDFAQIAPSRFAAALPGGAAPPPGVYGVGVRADGGQDARLPDEQALVAVPYPAEYRLQPADTSRLGGLASATGGRVLDAAAPVAALKPGDGDDLWRVPAAAAIVLLLAAVAVGRRGSRPVTPA